MPADALGLSVQWARVARAAPADPRGGGGAGGPGHDGGDRVRAARRRSPRSRRGATERSGALFLQDLFQAHTRLLVTGALRLDAWAHRDGRSVTTPLATSVSTTAAFPDRHETALSPRLGLVFRASPALSLTASGYGAFRGPTLNELYRSFRVGDTLTLANPALEAERLRGGEAGALVSRGPLSLRLIAFDAEVRGAVANVTLGAAPGLVTRQRRNVGRVRSRGLEAEAEVLFAGHGVLTAGYAFTDARVRSFPDDPGLEGRRVPQVPRHQATLQARYAVPARSGASGSEARWRLGLQARWTGAAWEDDRNQLGLDPAFQVDLFAARAIGSELEVFAAAENLLDADVVVARTPVAEPGRAAPPARGRAATALLSSADAPAAVEVGRCVQVPEEGGGIPVAGQLLAPELPHPHVGPEGRHPQLARLHPPADRLEAGGAVGRAEGLGAAGGRPAPRRPSPRSSSARRASSGHGNERQVDGQEEARASGGRGEAGQDARERSGVRDEVGHDRHAAVEIARLGAAEDPDVVGDVLQPGDRVAEEVGPAPGEERLVAPHAAARPPATTKPTTLTSGGAA